jgi:hypothetical protein
VGYISWPSSPLPSYLCPSTSPFYLWGLRAPQRCSDRKEVALTLSSNHPSSNAVFCSDFRFNTHCQPTHRWHTKNYISRTVCHGKDVHILRKAMTFFNEIDWAYKFYSGTLKSEQAAYVTNYFTVMIMRKSFVYFWHRHMVAYVARSPFRSFSRWIVQLYRHAMYSCAPRTSSFWFYRYFGSGGGDDTHALYRFQFPRAYLSNRSCTCWIYARWISTRVTRTSYLLNLTTV